MDSTEEKPTQLYYKIREVSEILNVSMSTLRAWEKDFPKLKPRRSPQSGHRYYTQEDIDFLRRIHTYVKVEGLSLRVARAKLENSDDREINRARAIASLTQVKKTLSELKDLLR